MGLMFCYQCEQTANCSGCQGSAGVCGKTANTARLQDQLTEALIGLARAENGNERRAYTDELMIKGLFATLTNVNFNDEDLQRQIDAVHKEKDMIVPGCAACEARCGRTDDGDMQAFWAEEEDIRSMKSLILFGVKGIAAYAWHARVLGYEDKEVNDFIYHALFMIGLNWDVETLLPLAMKTGEINLKCMELLHKANRETYGIPQPIRVTTTIEPGPFIVISGHDLHDLHQLLEQTKDQGINIYTHGEMLPAHGYPKLKAYPHLKGHYGTAWQNQQRELKKLPAPVLFTTNCLMPVKEDYMDNIFTTAVVSYPDVCHIGEDKDFTSLIERAKQLQGYHSAYQPQGARYLMTGFGHEAILSYADQILAAVQNKQLNHVFLVGGCDGAGKGRSYFREFVQHTPADTIVLTLACGKFRFNDLDLGSIGEIPRLLDMGQCNDAYSAIQLALALSEALDCGVNDLPLSMIISWYEQKAVSILLTLLHLGIKNIRLGPNLPAFISPGILKYLQDHFNLAPITEAKKDLEEILKRTER